jgi:hypothetical protein
MPTHVGREDVQWLVRKGAQLVEVLPNKEFDEQHLPGAIHLPLRKIDAGIRASVDPKRPVVVPPAVAHPWAPRTSHGRHCERRGSRRQPIPKAVSQRGARRDV